MLAVMLGAMAEPHEEEAEERADERVRQLHAVLLEEQEGDDAEQDDT